MTEDRSALVVGVNEYKNYSSSNLNGCVNDTVSMASFLKQFRGLDDSGIKVLTDAEATKANIMGGLEALVQGAIDGKYQYIAFTMSSHGTQLPDTEHDEPDRLDEAFCPHDLAERDGNWDPDHIIKDDELHDLFVRLPKSATVEVWLDTCHSGTGLKVMDLAPGRRIRYIPPPSMEAFKRAVEFEKAYGPTVVKKKAVKAKHILWSACNAKQTSADASIEGRWNGAFTYYFCQEAASGGAGQTPQELLKKVRSQLKANDYTQTPQYSDNATKR